MKVNQQYIADILQVSRVTVTKALQNHPDIAQKTKKKIQKLAEELGYIPNGIGRSLSTKKTYTIGVVVPKINHSFFSTVIEHLYSSASARGYQLILMVSFEDPEIEMASVRTLISMNVDGILIDTASATYSDKSYTMIQKNKIPMLFFDRKLRNFEANGIFFKDYDLSYEFTKKLIKKGYKKILYLTGPQQININFNRLAGFKDAMNDYGLKVPKGWVLSTSLKESGGCEAFKHFVNTSTEKPELVMCVNDTVALAVYEVCKELKISIPKDLGVVGFGDIRVSSLVNPPLSTVKLDLEMACTKAVQNLVHLIEGEKEEVMDELIPGEIILRESVR